MRILFDHGVPIGLVRALVSHTVVTPQARNWDRLGNGALLIGSTKWSRIRLHFERIVAAVDAATPGSYTEVPIPFD